MASAARAIAVTATSARVRLDSFLTISASRNGCWFDVIPKASVPRWAAVERVARRRIRMVSLHWWVRARGRAESRGAVDGRPGTRHRWRNADGLAEDGGPEGGVVVGEEAAARHRAGGRKAVPRRVGVAGPLLQPLRLPALYGVQA